MFVDDEKMLADSYKGMLESLGYQVTAKSSAVEALSLFKSDPSQFHMVITDQTMPHMTGEMLVGEVLKVRPDKDIILCSGSIEKIDEFKVREMGLKAFLLKPLSLRTLAQTVRKALDED